MCLGPEIVFALQVIGAVTATAGTAYSAVQGQKAANASKRAEALRKQQMQMEEMQKRRQAIRDFQAKRALAVSNISGATGTLDNSAYGGATSALSADFGFNLGSLQQASNIGEGMFQANSAYSEASANAQAGQQIAGFGKDIFQSAPAAGRIGATVFGS